MPGIPAEAGIGERPAEGADAVKHPEN